MIITLTIATVLILIGIFGAVFAVRDEEAGITAVCFIILIAGALIWGDVFLF